MAAESFTLPQDIPQREMLLDNLKNDIDGLSPQHHCEIYGIMKKNINVKLNESKMGCQINISYLPDDVLVEVYTYVHYIKTQEQILNKMEQESANLLKALDDNVVGVS